LGKDFEFVEQETQLGTGHAVLSAKNAVGKEFDTILVISIDQLEISKNTIQNILNIHQEKNPVMTIGTVIVPDFSDWRVGMYKHFGRIVRKNDGTVEKNVEFKDANEEQKKIKELNMALYAFNSNWLWENISKLKNENVQNEYYLTDLIQIASEQNKKIEAVIVTNIIEAIHPNSKEELEVLEKFAV
jgi:bifunctional N-acetylglucosamine-1-phosphate-uridyltransferase/glucosamine-1-phosphate-acetyltransferase GlmU-like protein